MNNELVVYEVNGEKVELSKNVVYSQLLSIDAQQTITEQELSNFIDICRYQKLNPFLREAYLVKYGNSPAQIIVGKDAFTKRANASKRCKGYNAGIIVMNKKNGEISRKRGTFYLPQFEDIVGGWAKIYRTDWEVPLENEVSFSEYNTGKSLWKNKPATMIRKVALVQGLREAFPEDFEGLYDASEMGVHLDNNEVPIGAVNNNDVNNNDIVECEDIEVVEDTPNNENMGVNQGDNKEAKQVPVEEENKQKQGCISSEQVKRLWSIAKGKKYQETVREVLKQFNYESTWDIQIKDYETICIAIDELVKAYEVMGDE